MLTPIHAFSRDGSLSPGAQNGLGGFVAQINTLTLPSAPTRGQTVTAVATAATALPAGVAWDGGVAPVVAAGTRRIIGLVWSGMDWVGTYSPPIPQPHSSLADAVLALSPAGYWPLDETTGTTAADASGNGRHGTYTGSTYTLNDRDGAPTFSAGGHVTIPDHESLSVGASGITLFGIGYVTADSASAGWYMAKGESGPGYEWSLGVAWPANGRLSQATWWDVTGNDFQAELSPEPHPKNRWVALAASFGVPATVGARFPLYRDAGTPLASVPAPDLSGTGSTRTAAPVRIAPPWIADGVFTGSLRHVAVFPRMLSAAEVGVLMTQAHIEGLIT